MNFQEIIRVALRALARNKLRTILTMLGIIIGVGAVIGTVAIGQGASAQVQRQIQALGNFLVAGAVAPLLQEAREKVQELFLSSGECHKPIVGEGKVK